MSQIANSRSRVNLWAGAVLASCLLAPLGACFLGDVPQPVNTFCSADFGPVSGMGVQNVGAITQCDSTYPTCNAPPMPGGTWQCCASRATGPVQPGFQCKGGNQLNPPDAGGD